ncbi:unnamed product [Ostreococcus tauri]|uniref:Unnamed product n=1 Tax=Ostreococcus tauri TaxID=70448 RepID=A0A090M5J5_OSTTA|nr:unnamed product [Ostreococcus tauri]CEF99461.1 unnamed product [Ostreococcus tauri]|eukprot:XP_022839847.1 unnamed product [Ostreococcus tauri]
MSSSRAVYVLVFDLDEPTESLYATSSRSSEGIPLNAFVAFEDMGEAVRAAIAVGEVASGGVPVVESAPPAAIRLLADLAGFDVEYVRKGDVFDVPEVLVEDASSGVDEEELKVSASELAKYLASGETESSADAMTCDAGDVPDEDREPSEHAIATARANAARSMRDALLAPARRVRDASAATARLPSVGSRTVVAGLGAAMRAFARCRRVSTDS